ncbi:MAG TPA: hypothetical protein VFF81_04145 [Noviherbaspirillum sp.]|nr:hypothetical protein [Noviherbaspirillum sp.]
MKRLPSILMLVPALFITACTSLSQDAKSASAADKNRDASTYVSKNARRSALLADRVKVHDSAGTVEVQKVEFRPGVSSVSVERLARRHACNGAGAGLITEKGPVEVYRMQCDNGTTFLARCELRQCRPMR